MSVSTVNAGVEHVVLGLYLIRGDNVVVIGEIDEDLDSRVNFENVRAEPLMSIVRG